MNIRSGQIVLVVNWADGTIAPISAHETREEAIEAATNQLKSYSEAQDEEEMVVVPATMVNCFEKEGGEE